MRLLTSTKPASISLANQERFRHGQLILVVDDEALILVTAKAALEANGYRVLTAADGAEALAAGAKAFLKKPYTDEQLLETLGRVLGTAPQEGEQVT